MNTRQICTVVLRISAVLLLLETLTFFPSTVVDPLVWLVTTFLLAMSVLLYFAADPMARWIVNGAGVTVGSVDEERASALEDVALRVLGICVLVSAISPLLGGVEALLDPASSKSMLTSGMAFGVIRLVLGLWLALYCGQVRAVLRRPLAERGRP